MSNEMNHKDSLLKKIESGQAKIGIVGMGYVGLPLAVAFAEAGYHGGVECRAKLCGRCG